MVTIRRNIALTLMDIRKNPKGKIRTFSIKFVTKSGNIHFFPFAYTCGLAKMNLKENRMRGIQPCDADGNPIDHIYPVNIDLILEFNNFKITF